MNKFTHIMLALIGVGFATSLNAATLTTFSAGTAANASEVNGNFTAINTELGTVGSDVTTLSGEVSTNTSAISTINSTLTTIDGYDISGMKTTIDSFSASVNPSTVAVDCDADGTALKTALDSATYSGWVLFNITGTCTEDTVVQKDRLVLIGDGSTILQGSMNFGGNTQIYVEEFVLEGDLVVSSGSSVELKNLTYEGSSSVVVQTGAVRFTEGDITELDMLVRQNGFARFDSGVSGTPVAITANSGGAILSKAIMDTDELIINHGGIAEFESDVTIGDLEVTQGQLTSTGIFTVEGDIFLKSANLFLEDNAYIQGDNEDNLIDASVIYVDGSLEIDNSIGVIATSIHTMGSLTTNGVFEVMFGSNVLIEGDVTGESQNYSDSSIVVDGSMVTNDLLGLYSSVVEIAGSLTTLAIESSDTNYYIESGLTFTGTHEDADDTSFELSGGCTGEISSVTFPTGDAWSVNSVFDGQYTRLRVGNNTPQDYVNLE